MVSEDETVLEDTNAPQDAAEAEMAETDDFETNEVLAASVGGDDTSDVPTDDFVGRGFARLDSLAGSTHTLFPLSRGSLL